VTLTEAIEALQVVVYDMERAGVDPNMVEVLMATQPGYPLAATIAHIVEVIDPETGGPVVYIAEGLSRGYAPSAAFAGEEF
jgi:hypothetical protein